MLKYELQKLLNSRIAVICIILSMVITLYFAYIHFRGSSRLIDDTGISNYEGRYNDELYEKIQNEYNLIAAQNDMITMYERGIQNRDNIQDNEKSIDNMSDVDKEEVRQNFYKWMYLYNSAEECARVTEYRSNVLKNAKRLSKSGNSYLRKVNTNIMNMYGKKVDLRIISGNLSAEITEKWDMTEYADYLNIICIIVLVCESFVVEHSRSTYSMIFSSYRGRKRLYTTKVINITIFVILFALLTTFFQLIPAVMNDNFKQIMGMDIQNMEYFMYSPYVFKVYQLWLIIGVLRMLGYIAIAMFMVCFTAFFEKSVIPFNAGLIIFCGGYGILSKILQRKKNLMINGRSVSAIQEKINLFRKYTPFGIIRSGNSYFANYEPNNIMGIPITNLRITITINILYCLIFAISGYVVYRYRFRKKGVG